MKQQTQRLLHLQSKIKSIQFSRTIELIEQRTLHYLNGIRFIDLKKTPGIFWQEITWLLNTIKSIGFTQGMEEYEKRKLGIFNQLNFLQLITGIIVPLVSLFNDEKLSSLACFLATLPAFISLLVLSLNYYRKFDAAMISYFILYPVITSIIYLGGMNLGVELFFILYGILSVFFLQELSQMLFSVSLSMVSYFVLSVVWKHYQYQLATAHLGFYLFNQALAIIFIFYGLYLIKKENTGYQFNILAKSRILHKKNLEIQQQKKEIVEKARLLEKQTTELTELNSLKNKLFSVIAHDLKTPMYALRNLFSDMKQQDLPGEEIKTMIPDVLNDLNYTTGLMENLLQWAKSQMQISSIKPQLLEISKMTEDVLQLLRLQANAKNIYMESKVNSPVYVMADRDMINLVLRNLLSNAIKFTNQQGYIEIGIKKMSAFVEVYVHDNGTGMSAETLRKIEKKDYFTTNGTESESGTGLGLMLCREFVIKNGGQMNIRSKVGEGSIFSFTLPRANTN
ncbi:MAG: HAMP domain-containing histidine kinase [Bacteroidota bacterium]|nr:HAMP domain-containing histidine kinase [Bacteroidota bacterium]